MAFNWDTHGASLAILPLDAQGEMKILFKHSLSHIVTFNIGTPVPTNIDEFSEKLQTAFDPRQKFMT